MAAKTRMRMRSRMKRLVYIYSYCLPLGRSADIDIRVMVESRTKTLPSASKANENRGSTMDDGHSLQKAGFEEEMHISKTTAYTLGSGRRAYDVSDQPSVDHPIQLIYHRFLKPWRLGFEVMRCGILSFCMYSEGFT